MFRNHRSAMAVRAAETHAIDQHRGQDRRHAVVERLCLYMQRAEPDTRETDRLRPALDELYPLPTCVPDDLSSLINAVLDTTRRCSSS